MKHLLKTLSALLLAFAPVTHSAPVVDRTDPHAVVRAVSTHMAANDWHSAAALFEPGELKEFRALMEEISPGRMGAAMPNKPGALSDAEYVGRVMAEGLGRVNVQLGGVNVLGHVEESAELWHFICRQRVTLNGFEMTTIEVVSLRRVDGKWWALFGEELQNFKEVLRQRKPRAEAEAGAMAAPANGKDEGLRKPQLKALGDQRLEQLREAREQAAADTAAAEARLGPKAAPNPRDAGAPTDEPVPKK